jgi:hypothetical protein
LIVLADKANATAFGGRERTVGSMQYIAHYEGRRERHRQCRLLWYTILTVHGLSFVSVYEQHSQTPLHLAAEHDHSEVLKLFLKHNPERLSVPNKNGYTCAHIAAAKGSVAVIRELMRLNQESVINARISVIENLENNI